MPAYFCTKTHERIAAPGVCLACDPVNGQAPFVSEPVAAPEPASVPAPTKKPGDGRNK